MTTYINSDIVRRLVDIDPIHHVDTGDVWGGYSECHWCEAIDQPNHPGIGNIYRHRPDCPWVAGRRSVGMDLDVHYRDVHVVLDDVTSVR